MVSGGNAFAPKPQDGLIFIFEPLRTLAAEIIDQSENLTVPALRSSIYAIALLLLFSSFMLSLASRAARRPNRPANICRVRVEHGCRRIEKCRFYTVRSTTDSDRRT